MDLKDLLEKEFPEAHEKLVEWMKNAPEGLYPEMIKVLKKDSAVFDWYYNTLPAHGGKSPYELALKGDAADVKEILGRMWYEEFS